MQAIELIIFRSVEIVDEQTQAVYDVSSKSANPGMQKPEEKGLKKSGLGLRAEEVGLKTLGLGLKNGLYFILILIHSSSLPLLPSPMSSALIPRFLEHISSTTNGMNQLWLKVTVNFVP